MKARSSQGAFGRRDPNQGIRFRPRGPLMFVKKKAESQGDSSLSNESPRVGKRNPSLFILFIILECVNLTALFKGNLAPKWDIHKGCPRRGTCSPGSSLGWPSPP